MLAATPSSMLSSSRGLKDRMNIWQIHSDTSPMSLYDAGVGTGTSNLDGLSLFTRNSYELSSATKSYLDNLIQRILNVPGDSIIGLSVTGSCSPDGPSSFNDRLALSRANAVASYLNRKLRLDDQSIHCYSAGENWKLFRSLVIANPEIPGRDALLIIIDSEDPSDIKEQKIKSLDNGRVLKFLLKDIYPALRIAEIRIDFTERSVTDTISIPSIAEYKETHQPSQPNSEANNSDPETEIFSSHSKTEDPPATTTEATSASSKEEPLHAYIKTNIPAWGMLWINGAGEFDIAPHWSANVSLYYSGFNYFTHTRKFRTFTVMPEVRYWFRRDNQGFFVAPHFGLGWYNCAFGGEYRYQDHNRRTPAIGGGVNAGFRFNISRNGRWRLETSVGFGAYRLDYDIFVNDYNGLLVDRRQRTFYGIDNAAISICYMFDLRNRRVKKPSSESDF